MSERRANGCIFGKNVGKRVRCVVCVSMYGYVNMCVSGIIVCLVLCDLFLVAYLFPCVLPNLSAISVLLVLCLTCVSL